MEHTHLPLQFFISIVETVLVSLIGLILLNFKINLKKVIVIGLTGGILGSFIDMMSFPFGIYTFLQLITLSLVIYLVISIPYKLSFIISLLGFIISGCIEILIFPVLLYITGLSFLDVSNNIWLKFIFFLIVVGVKSIIILLLIYFKINLSKYFRFIINPESIDISKESSKAFPLISLILIQNFIILLFFAIYSIYYYKNINLYNILKIYYFLPLMITLSLTIAIVNIIKRTLENIQKENETKTQLDTLHYVEELVQIIRTQRHTFQNHLQTIYDFLEVKDFKEAQSYIKSNSCEVAATSEILKTDNLGITALLYTKSGLAEANKIKFNVNIETSLEHLPLKAFEVNIILGNLIDYALESVNNNPTEKREVEVKLSQDLNNYVLIVRNYGLPVKQEVLENMFKSRFSYTRSEKGKGLYSAAEIVKKYNGRIQVKSDNNYTSFEVYIPN